jgi:hypothetical protein
VKIPTGSTTADGARQGVSAGAQSRIITTAHIHDATCGTKAGQTIILCHLHLMPRRPSLGPPLCRNSTLAQDQHFDRKIDKANLGARPT